MDSIELLPFRNTDGKKAGKEFEAKTDLSQNGSSCYKIEKDRKSNVKDDTRDREDIKVGILGYGDYGKAFASRLQVMGFTYLVGSRCPARWKERDSLKVVSYKEMIAGSDLIILAINAKNYEGVLESLREDLTGKIVVDISNAEKIADACNAQHLANLLPSSKIVKAFNTVSAWSMSNDIHGASRNVYVCADDDTSRKTVMHFALELGFTPVEHGRLRGADALEKLPLQLFPKWRSASWITLGLLTFVSFYYLLVSFLNDEPKKVIRHLALYHVNRIVCWMALWLLALVYLPGCIAGLLQLYRGTKYSMFPNWLDLWMKSRKQLGLFGLGFAGIHACLSCLVLGTGYVKYMSKAIPIPGTNQFVYHQLHWYSEVSLLFAVLAMTLFIVLGITSLPSVNQIMSWREWDFVQSKLGYVLLFFAFSHVTIQVHNVYNPRYMKYWKYYLPPPVFLQPLFPGFVLILKSILLVPGVKGRLKRIRKGWEARASKNMEHVIC